MTKDIQNICDIYNKYTTDIIQTLRDKITSITIQPITILKTLIPRQLTNFNLPLATMEDVTRIINKAKPSHSTEWDKIDMKTIKKPKQHLHQ